MTRLLTKGELAEHLKVSPRTIDRLCREGKLHYRLAGSRKRFSPSDVESYLSRHLKPLSRPASTL